MILCYMCMWFHWTSISMPRHPLLISVCISLSRPRPYMCVWVFAQIYVSSLRYAFSCSIKDFLLLFFLFFFWYYGISHDSTRYIYIYISISIYHMLHIRVTYIRRLYALKMSQRRPENDSSTETHNRIKIIECRTLPMITYILVVFE